MFYQWLKTVFLYPFRHDGRSKQSKERQIYISKFFSGYTISKMNAIYDTNKELSKELSPPLNVNVSF